MDWVWRYGLVRHICVYYRNMPAVQCMISPPACSFVFAIVTFCTAEIGCICSRIFCKIIFRSPSTESVSKRQSSGARAGVRERDGLCLCTYQAHRSSDPTNS